MRVLTSNSIYMMEKSVDFLWTKQTAILDNLANVETPGYKTKYVTFEETLRDRLMASPSGGRDTRRALESVTPTLRVAEDETARSDGNGVNALEQNMELSRIGYQQQYVYDAINRDFAMLRSAIKGQ